MAKTNLALYDIIIGNNTDLGGTDITDATGKVTNGGLDFRTVMSHLAKFYDDFGGIVTVGGSANAITITSSSTHTALATGIRIRFAPSASNSGAATLNLDSLGAKAIRKYIDGTDVALVANDLLASRAIDMVYNAAANSAAGGWMIDPVGNLYLPSGGFIDFATADITITHSANLLTFAGASSGYSFDAVIVAANTNGMYRSIDTGLLILAGGSSSTAGARVALYGGTHATQASDYEWYAAANRVHFFDSSANDHAWYTTGGTRLLHVTTTGLEQGTFSTSGATNGWVSVDGLTYSSRSGSSAVDQYRFYNANGQVGGISTNGSATAFNTSSDERLKQNFRDFDALALLASVSVYHYDWKAGGEGYGPKAQELYQSFPIAVTPGNDVAFGDENFVPWAYDASKLVPVLIKAVQELTVRVKELEG